MITKIAVTGTKGKTTVVNLIAQFFVSAKAYDAVLHVNTTGHFLNGRRKSTLDDSVALTGLVPTVAPGRYLYDLPKGKSNNNYLAVLECALGCSSVSGMGYSRHEVGIFLNVFEDHLGSSERLKTRRDIFKAKSFVFERIQENGWSVLNVDDRYVMSALNYIKQSPRQYKVILFGLRPHEEVQELYPETLYVTVEDGWVVYYNNLGKKRRIVDSKKVVWTFRGLYTPSLYNLMAIVSGIVATRNGQIYSDFSKRLADLRLPEDGGRLTLFESKSGALVIADYAHEKKSLVEIANLAHKLKQPKGNVIGVVRLAYDRTDKLIHETGKAISTAYDHLIVYDKIDGYWRKPRPVKGLKFTQEVGKISEKLASAIRTKNTSVKRILREDLAIQEAANFAKKGDVVVCIVNDDIKRSISFIKKSFRVT